MRLPECLTLPLCREMAHLALDAKLLGGLDAGPWPDALAKWRDDGGVVEATRLALACGRLTLERRGNLRSRSGRPADRRDDGADPGLRGGARRVDGDKVIPAHTAATAKILLRAMARSGGEGVPILTAPVSIQDRTVSVGPVPLLRLPALTLLQGLERAKTRRGLAGAASDASDSRARVCYHRP